MRAELYDRKYEDKWNSFISCAQNSTFLFNRRFLEYHADRFKDFSILVFDTDGNIEAVVPANISDKNVVFSHQGLTYGGFVIKPCAKLLSVIRIVYCVLEFLNNKGINEFTFKQFPSFYNRTPTQEIDYILFLIEAKLFRRDAALVVDMQNRIQYSGNIRREGNKAEKLSAQIIEDDSMTAFWNQVLTPELKNKYGVKPVHSIEEIELLKRRFPDEIKQFNVYLDNNIVAGTTLFITDQVAHCQYISATELGRKSGCLNYLFKHLVDNVFCQQKYFDFGIVNEENGRYVNSGMLFWKESFGGRTYTHDFFSIETSSYTLLKKYLN